MANDWDPEVGGTMVVWRVTRWCFSGGVIASSAFKVLLGMLDGEARGGVAEGHGVSGSLVRSHGKTWPTGGFPPTCGGNAAIIFGPKDTHRP